MEKVGFHLSPGIFTAAMGCFSHCHLFPRFLTVFWTGQPSFFRQSVSHFVSHQNASKIIGNADAKAAGRVIAGEVLVCVGIGLAHFIWNMNDIEKRLLKLLAASPEKLAVIDRILEGQDFEVKPDEPRPAPTGPLLMQMGAAAKLLGVSRATIWRMLKAGRLEAVEILPGSTRLRRADVEAIAARPTKPIGGHSCRR